MENTPNPAPSGLYVDLENSASCSGQIVKWNLCYYNPRHFNSMLDSYQIGLHVWRFDQQQQNGGLRLVGINTVTVNIPQQLHDFQCVSIGVLEGDYINVTTGDVLGITLFSNDLLPVLANDLGVPEPQIRYFMGGVFPPVDLNIQDSAIVSDNFIHVTAEIGNSINS